MLVPFELLIALFYLNFFLEDPVDNYASISTSCFYVLIATFFTFLTSLIFVNLGSYIHTKQCLKKKLATQVKQYDIFFNILLLFSFYFTLNFSQFPISFISCFSFTSTKTIFILQLLVSIFLYLVLFTCIWLPVNKLYNFYNYPRYSKTKFLIYKAHYTLYILIAVLPLITIHYYFYDISNTVIFISSLAAIWIFPYFISLAYHREPFTDGKILFTIRELEKSLKLYPNKFFLWNLGSNKQNAGAIGILPPFQYIFITKPLYKNMLKDEVTAVILHELGHIKHKHLIFLTFTIILALDISRYFFSDKLITNIYMSTFLGLITLLIYFRLIFGWLSRCFERQADIFALEHMNTQQHIVNALEKLAISAGKIRLAYSWHHDSIASRVNFLENAVKYPELILKHQRLIKNIKIIIVIFFIIYLLIKFI